MLNLILALSSGVVGGLIVAVIPQTGRRLRNLVVLVFSVSGVVFSWRVAQMVFADRGSTRKVGTKGPESGILYVNGVPSKTLFSPRTPKARTIVLVIKGIFMDLFRVKNKTSAPMRGIAGIITSNIT
jgi:hypothetical protein